MLPTSKLRGTNLLKTLENGFPRASFAQGLSNGQEEDLPESPLRPGPARRTGSALTGLTGIGDDVDEVDYGTGGPLGLGGSHVDAETARFLRPGGGRGGEEIVPDDGEEEQRLCSSSSPRTISDRRRGVAFLPEESISASFPAGSIPAGRSRRDYSGGRGQHVAGTFSSREVERGVSSTLVSSRDQYGENDVQSDAMIADINLTAKRLFMNSVSDATSTPSTPRDGPAKVRVADPAASLAALLKNAASVSPVGVSPRSPEKRLHQQTVLLKLAGSSGEDRTSDSREVPAAGVGAWEDSSSIGSGRGGSKDHGGRSEAVVRKAAGLRRPAVSSRPALGIDDDVVRMSVGLSLEMEQGSRIEDGSRAGAPANPNLDDFTEDNPGTGSVHQPTVVSSASGPSSSLQQADPAAPSVEKIAGAKNAASPAGGAIQQHTRATPDRATPDFGFAAEELTFGQLRAPPGVAPSFSRLPVVPVRPTSGTSPSEDTQNPPTKWGGIRFRSLKGAGGATSAALDRSPRGPQGKEHVLSSGRSGKGKLMKGSRLARAPAGLVASGTTAPKQGAAGKGSSGTVPKGADSVQMASGGKAPSAIRGPGFASAAATKAAAKVPPGRKFVPSRFAMAPSAAPSVTAARNRAATEDTGAVVQRKSPRRGAGAGAGPPRSAVGPATAGADLLGVGPPSRGVAATTGTSVPSTMTGVEKPAKGTGKNRKKLRDDMETKTSADVSGAGGGGLRNRQPPLTMDPRTGAPEKDISRPGAGPPPPKRRSRPVSKAASAVATPAVTPTVTEAPAQNLQYEELLAEDPRTSSRDRSADRAAPGDDHTPASGGAPKAKPKTPGSKRRNLDRELAEKFSAAVKQAPGLSADLRGDLLTLIKKTKSREKL